MRTPVSMFLVAIGAVAAGLMVGCATTPIHLSDDWIVVDSPHFEIMSTLDFEKTIGLAEDLERFRALIHATTTAPRSGATMPPSEAWLSYRLVSAVQKTQLGLPSIGSERKAYFPFRPRFFDPGVCSRSGWTVSSRDVAFMVRSEHRPNSFERLA